MSQFNINSIADLFQVSGDQHTKVAEEVVIEGEQSSPEQSSDEQEKLAEDLYYAGCIAAEGLVDRALEKIAMAVPAAGGGVEPRSKWESICREIASRRGLKMKPGSDVVVDADAKGYPGHGSQSGRSLSKAKNPGKALS